LQDKSSESKVLYSWREIGAFLHCGVRTVQRWEREEKFPVHRNHQRGVTVYAVTSEIEVWLRTRELGERNSAVPTSKTRPSASSALDQDLLWSLCLNARERAQRVRGEATFSSPSISPTHCESRGSGGLCGSVSRTWNDGRKRVLLIAAATLATRTLIHWNGRPSQMLESAIVGAISLAECRSGISPELMLET